MNWKSVCGAVQGRGHAKKNIPCQDKVARHKGNGVHVIALADGAGSAKFSHYGAEVVVNRIAAFTAENFFDLIAQEDGRKVTQEILSVVAQALTEEAELRGCTLKDLASTLLVAAVDDENFFLAHLGDGVIGYLDDAGLKVASTPDNGEFSNETFFTTSANAAAHMRIYKGKLKNISGFVLMSDGTEQSLYNKRNKTLATGVKRLLHRTCLIDEKILMPQLEEALSSIIALKTQDDCSIALLARTSEQLPPLNKLPLSERHSLYQISGSSDSPKVLKRIRRCDEICILLEEPMILEKLARELYLKPSYVIKKLQPLLKAGVIIKTDKGYKIYGN